MTWLTLAVLAALASGCIVFVIGAATMRRRGSNWRRVITASLLWVWAWGIAAMTLGTRSGGGYDLNLKPLDVTNRIDVADFWLNMLMFAPIGVLLAARGASFWWALLAGFGGSFAIEVTQYTLATGRTADVNDLVSNTLGCVLGFAIAAAGMRLMTTVAPSPREAVRPGR
jgi:glycopeptide antibiotics resistance protein